MNCYTRKDMVDSREVNCHPDAVHLYAGLIVRGALSVGCNGQIGSEVAQSNAAWLLESGHCSGGSSFNSTQVSCEKR